MEKAMAPHASTLAWKIPCTEEPGRLQSMGSLRVRHDWATSLLLFTFMHWRRKWQPTPVFLPGESQGRGSWWAAVYGVTQSRTWLKWRSSSSRAGYKINTQNQLYFFAIKKKGKIRKNIYKINEINIIKINIAINNEVKYCTKKTWKHFWKQLET